ncbi:MAG: endolytic transglycosylase MltG [Rhodospirillaceae bacterium]|nr:endolytic transglycosylase MltG [Rhodospirillaceae bacterium]MBT4751745.1 endolytic transglycosylase MltG [Rhodospirillaceae bacterium]MBT5840446.1 endolytic transglycosylase MltG [Rhodospirillaceae bacterium]MBT7568791.1 endolytic transglycosylase MltG [Rhodospirillaceae bacterium]
MGRLFRWFAALAVLAIIIASGGGFFAYEMFRQSGPSEIEQTLVIPNGHRIGTVAEMLRRTGIISHEIVLRIGARLYQPEFPLKAGEYSFPKGASARQVLDILRHGKTVVRRLTVAEGLTTFDVLARLGATEGLKGSAPQGLGEGQLLPETYHFSYGDARADIVRRMRAAMTSAVERLWAARVPDLPLNSPAEALILASIIEKETGLAEERARVASVFINRLRAGMRLQSDPTVVYALTHGQGKLGRRLTRTDLRDQSLYNTYVHKGLPPGPIANPGIAAIAAALNPARSGDLYFVADGSGGHVFARTLAAHNRNVRRWRKLQKARQKKH